MWLSRLNHWLSEKIPCALVTIISIEGSTPREPGAKMTVNVKGEIAGTVGGGALEHDCIARAIESIKSGKTLIHEYKLDGGEWVSTADGKEKKALCGGRTTVFIEPVYPDKALEVLIFGAGHIGEQLAKYCAILSWPCKVFDDRPEFLTKEKYPEAELILGEFTKISDKIKPEAQSYCVIMTYGHVHDQEVLEQLLRIPEIPYIGMIGSRAKVAVSLQMMEKKGLKIGPRVYTPIGFNLGVREPAEIALAISAEIKAVQEGVQIRHMRDPE
ncbi:MAG: XdhC family protein [Candidatus Wallbacteria bacterium]|nr:XdhC family protein [Candidatus Wallbacteria bacterium]